MRLKRSATAILAVASLFALAACGGGSGSNPSAPTQTQGAGGGAGAGKNPDAKGPLAVPADAASGGTVTVLTSQVPATFDPTRAYYTDSTSILNLVTRGLTQYAYNPQTKDMELVPDMATDLGTHNKDMTEWSFTLKDGLKYEDGSPVKAEDIAYAISRSFAIEELPDGPTYQLQFFLDGDKYKGPYKDKSPYKGVTVDGNTITIKMSRPFPDMDYYASFPTFTGDPAGQGHQGGLRQPPVGDRSLHVQGLQARHVADAGEEPQLGPRHRPGPHPVGGRVRLRVQPGPGEDREHHPVGQR